VKYTRFFTSIIIICTFFFEIIPAKNPTQIIISPLISQIDSTFVPFCDRLPPIKFDVQSVIDESPSRDSSGIVGETRIRRNTMQSIICNPVPSEVVRRSLLAILSGCNNASDTGSEASSQISITIVEFSLKETSKRITQTMDASIILKVIVSSPAGTITPKQFTVSAGSSYTTLDTSKHSERILRQALSDALREILKNCE